MRFFSAESLDFLAQTWLDCARTAFLQGFATLAFVSLFWHVLRKHLGNSFAHGLFFLVPVKTAAAALFVAWPVVISISIPVSESIFSAVYPPPALEIGSKTAMSGQMQSLEQAVEQPKIPVEAIAGGPIADINPISEPVEFNAAQVVTLQETPAAASSQVSISVRAWLLLAWAGTCVLLLAVNFLKHVRMLKRFSHLSSGYSEINQQKVNKLATALGLDHAPRLVESSGVATPAVVGLARPKLVVPPGFFESFDTDQQAWILLHELAHIRRRDLWWLAFERAVGVTFFFNPALWISSRATRHFRELACDDIAQMQSGLTPRDCAETFLKLIHWSLRKQSVRGSITPTLSLTDRYPAIQRRIMNMTELNASSHSNRLSKISIAFIMATAILISMPFSPKLVARPTSMGEAAIATAPSVESNVAQNEEPVQIPLDDKSVVLRLIDETNQKAIEGAKVIAMVDDRSDTLTTNNQGFVRASFEKSKNDSIQFIVYKEGYIPKIQAWTRHESEEFPPPRQVTWKMQKGMKVGGRVVDTTGKPISNGLVRVYYSVKEFPSSSYPDMRLEPVVTDAEGRWTTSQIPNEARQISVSVLHKNFLTDPIPTPFYPPFEPLKTGTYQTVMSPGAVFKGRLTANGQPVEGATIFRSGLNQDETEKLAVTSDKNGEFKVEGLHFFNGLVLAFTKPGLASQIIRITREDLSQVKTWEMQPGKSVRGVVKDTEGKAISNVRFIPMEFNRQQIRLNWNTRTTTDENGRFEISDLQAGPVEFLVAKPGYFWVPMKFYPSDEKPAEVKLAKETVVSGTVKDKTTGQSIKTVEIKLATHNIDQDDISFPMISNRLSSGNRFRYYLSFTPMPERFKLRFEALGYLPFTTPALKITDKLDQMEVLLEPDPRAAFKYKEISGLILQPDGKPASGATISVKSKTRTPFLQNGRIVGVMDHERYSLANANPVVSDDHGQFKLQYSVNEAIEGIWVTHATGAFRLENPDLSRNSHELKLKPYARIEGQYLVDGKPASLGVVRLNFPLIRQGWDLNQVATPDNSGRFTIENIFPDEFSLIYPGLNAIRHPGKKYKDIKPGETLRVEANLIKDEIKEKRLAMNEEFAIPVVSNQAKPEPTKQVHPKSIGGTVVDESGKPRSGVKVVLDVRVKDPSSPTKQKRVRLDEGMTTDRDGKWSTDKLPADAMDLMVRVEDPVLVTSNRAGNYHLPPFPYLTDGRDRLEVVTGQKATLRVVDEAGKPVANADVYDPANNTITRDMKPIGKTDASGVYTMNNLRNDYLIFVIKATGFAPAVQIMKNENQIMPAEIKFVMKPGRTIKGRLVDDSGQPVANHEIEVYDRSLPYYFIMNLRTVTDANGHFECKDVPRTAKLELSSLGGDFETLAHPLNETVEDLGTVKINALSHADVKLVDSETGKPITSAWVYFQYEIPGPKSWVTAFPTKHVSDDGHFEQSWRQEPNLKNYLVAVADGYEPYVHGPFMATGKKYEFTFSMKKRPEKEFLDYSGHLHQPDGKPAEGATFYTVSNEPGVVLGQGRLVWGGYLDGEMPKKTAKDGSFTILEDKKIRQVLVTHESGFLFLDNPAGMQPDKNLDWKLKPWARVKGKVTRDGKPMAGYLLANEASRFKRVRPFRLEYSSATTNSDGTFEFNRVMPDGSELIVSQFTGSFGRALVYSEYFNVKPGEFGEVNIELNQPPKRLPANENHPAPAAAKTEIKPVAAEKRPELIRTIKIGGVVVDENDKPIQGATAHVTVYYPKNDQERVMNQVELESRPSDTQGKWSIDSIPATAESMALELTHPQKIAGFRYGSDHQKPFRELRSGELKMQMKDGMKLTIRVKDERQNPVRGAAIFDVLGYRRKNDIPVGYTDAKGEFTSENNFPGPNRFIISKKAYAPELLKVDAQPSLPVQEVSLSGGKTVTGTIIDWNSKPIAGAEVRLGSYKDVGVVPNYQERTDINGHFEMKYLPWDPVVLTISHPKIRIEKPVNTIMTDLGQFRIEPVNILKVHVTDKATGKPVTAIANYRFTAEDNSTSTFTRIGLQHNPEGLFEEVFYPAKTEKFKMLFLAEGYEPYLSEPIEFDEAHTSNELNVALKKPANIITYRGKAVQPDGKPAAGFTVRFTPMNPGVKVGQMHFTWQIGEFKEIKTAEDGSFEFQNPGPIQELLIVGEDDSFYSNEMTGWKGEVKSLVLNPKTIISGRVTDNGKARFGVRVSPVLVRPDIYIPLWNGLQNLAFTDSQGHYRLPCIYPGTIQLNFSNDHNSVVGKNYEIKPGENKTINFDFNEMRVK